MRTALRTSIVTAALAGALLAPAAGTAFAASGMPGAAPVAQQAVAATSAAASGDETADLGGNLVAHMSNSAAGGPRVEIRAVIDGKTEPGIVATLDRAHTKVSKQGVIFELTKADTAAPVLTVFMNGVTKSYPLPAAEAGADCRSGLKGQPMGGGMRAELRVTENGPQASLIADPDGRAFATLYRTEPSLPESAGIIARIVNPSSATPVFEWKTEGGNSTVGRTSFPAFPKGCKPNYKFTDDKPVTKPTTPAPTKPQTAGQTTVVPKGPVAAGAELPAETASGAGGTATMAAGAGLIAAFGALGASVVLRRRRATQG
ncbi:hypothetical protein [Streptomyces sp. NPDC006463]|uniref:hypothetical protein n=1 Tax=Streptomyces sp. NPDC006463 TaxID=3364746 RepID=UPI0036C43FB9